MRFFNKQINIKKQPATEQKAGLFLEIYLKTILGLLCFCLVVALPYAWWWIYESGDLAVERAVQMQTQGQFALFGSGISQNFSDYKLQLYADVKPKTIALGSSRVMQFRAKYFSTSFVNMGGMAGNLPVLRTAIDQILRIHKPENVLLGLDFWWFLPEWNADPYQQENLAGGTFDYTLNALKKPFAWLLTGKITPLEFFAPLLKPLGYGFRSDRFGIMAQQGNDGFGSDGSWYATSEITGQKKPFDFQFRDTLTQVVYGLKAFAPAQKDKISAKHLDAFAEIYYKLKSRGIKTFVFIAPLSENVLQALRSRKTKYPHLFELWSALRERGVEVLDFTDPRMLASNNCEFLDGFHGGEVIYARILQRMSDAWPTLLACLNIDTISETVNEWAGHAFVRDTRVTELWETDFMRLGCLKRTVAEESNAAH